MDPALTNPRRWGDEVFAAIYFGVQRTRGGVRPHLITEAERLLGQSWPEVQAYVGARLRALHGVQGSPFGWLRSQALVERTTLRGRVAEIERGLAAGARVERRRTSGSSGTPFSFPKDLEMTARMDAVMWAVYRWHGIAPGARHVRFWGMPLRGMPRLKKQAVDFLMHRRRIDAFRLTPERAIACFSSLRRFQPTYAYGYPALIRQFAEYCVAAGLDGRELGVRTVVTTGELLPPETRRAIGAFFGCNVVNEYGCTESGVLAFECESGQAHVTPAAAYPEVLRPDGTDAGPDEPGEVVVTDLFGRTLPLVRYRLHDRARWHPNTCGCGRELPILAIDSGRIDSFIQTPHRGQVYDAILAYTVPAGVQRFRARQLAVDRLTVDLVPGTGFDAEDTPRECRRRWEEALGPGMEVTTRVVADIPHEPSGKLKYFVPLGSPGEAAEREGATAER